MRFIDLTTGEGAKGVYRYARMFLPRKMAEMVANAYRKGDIGERRLLMSAVVRAAAQSRGIAVTKNQADKWLETSAEKIRVTGRREAELYAGQMTEATRPSRMLAEAQAQMVADDAAEEAAQAAAEAARGIPMNYSGFRTLRELVDDAADEIENQRTHSRRRNLRRVFRRSSIESSVNGALRLVTTPN